MQNMHAATWLAGRVRRWHTHPYLADTHDYTDGHAARMQKMLLMFFKEQHIDQDLLVSCLMHDEGEYAVGDLSYRIKRKDPTLAAMVAKHEQEHIASTPVHIGPTSPTQAKMVKLVDRIDAYFWCLLHRPSLALEHIEWVAMWTGILMDAGEMDRDGLTTGPLVGILEAMAENIRNGLG